MIREGEGERGEEDGPDGDEEDAARAESPGSLTPVESPFSGKGEEVAVCVWKW